MALDPIYKHPTEGEIDYATLESLAIDQGLTVDEYITEFNVVMTEVDDSKKEEVAVVDAPVATPVDSIKSLELELGNISSELGTLMDPQYRSPLNRRYDKTESKLKKLYRDSEMNMDIPETIIDRTEGEVKTFLFENYSDMFVDFAGTPGNMLNVTLDGEVLQLDLQPFTDDGRQEAVDVLKKIDSYHKNLSDEEKILNTVGTLAGSLNEFNDTGSINKALEGSGFTVSKNEASGSYKDNTKVKESFNVFKDGKEVLSKANTESLTEFMETNIGEEGYKAMKENSYQAFSRHLSAKEEAFDKEKKIIGSNKSLDLKYYKEGFKEDFITSLSDPNDPNKLTEKEIIEINNYFNDQAAMKLSREMVYNMKLDKMVKVPLNADDIDKDISQLADLSGLSEGILQKIEDLGGEEFLAKISKRGLDGLRLETLNNRKQTIGEKIMTESGEQFMINLSQRIGMVERDIFKEGMKNDISQIDPIYNDRLGGILETAGARIMKNSPRGTKFSMTYLNELPIYKLENNTKDLTKTEQEQFKKAELDMYQLQNDVELLNQDRRLTIQNMESKITEFYANNPVDKQVFQDSMREYGMLGLLAKDVNDAFASGLLALPTLVNSEWALQQQKRLNSKSQFYETMGTYDDGNFGTFALRTLGQQSFNIVAAIATGAAGKAIGFTEAMTANAIGTTFGLTSGAQTYRDLKTQQQIVGTADKQAVLAREAFDSGRINYYRFTQVMKDINKSRAMTEISDNQIVGASIANGIIEGTFTRFLGTAPNTIKLLDDFAPKAGLIKIATNLYNKNYSKVANLIGKPLVLRGAGELAEEELIYGGQALVTDYGILNKELDFSQWDETAVSTFITLGATQSPGVAYSGLLNYGATKKFEKEINSLRSSNNELSVLLQDIENVDSEKKKAFLFDMAENLKEQGLNVDRLAVDMLSLDATDIKRLIGTELIKNQLLSQAGVTPGMSDVEIANQITIYKKSLTKDQIKRFDGELNVLNKQVNNIKDETPNYKKAKESLGDLWTVNNKYLDKQDKDGYKAKNTQDKIVAVINHVRESFTRQSIKNAKSQFSTQVDAMTQFVDGVDTGKPLTVKQKNDKYAQLGNMLALDAGRALATSIDVNKKAEIIFKDLKNVQIVEFKNKDQALEALEGTDVDINTPEFAEALKKLEDNKTFGLVIGNTIITQNPDAAAQDLKEGIVRAGTVVLHEFSHIQDDARITNDKSRKMYADNLLKAATETKNRDLAFRNVEVLSMLDVLYEKEGLTFENSDKYRDEYTKYMQEALYAYEDQIRIEKDDSLFTKIFNNTNPNNLNTPEKALNYLAANNAAFRSGKISRRSRRAINNSKSTQEIKLSEKSTVNKLAVEFKNKPDSFNKNKYTDFFTQYQSVAVDAMGYNIAKGDILANDAMQFVAAEFKSIMNTFDPNKGAFTTHVVNTFKNRRANKFYKQEFAPKDVSLTRIGKGFDVIDQDSNESLDDREAREDSETTSKIDPRKFKIAIPKIKQIESAVDITVEEDIAPFKADFKAISAKYGTKVAGILYNIDASKLQKNANLTYAKKISKDGIPENSEAGRIQEDFDTRNDQEVRKFLKLLPPENVTSKESEVGTQGESIAVSKDVQGRSLGLPGRVLDFFYDKKTSERSSGLTSQPFIRKLKSKYGANTKITSETIKELQEAMGITPARQLNKYDRTIGTFLAGVAKLKGAIVTNTVARVKVDKMDTSKSSKPKKQIIADMGSGRSSVQFSEKANKEFNLQLPGRLKVNSLLNRYELNPTLNLKSLVVTDKGRKEIIKTYKENAWPFLPREAWQQRDSFTNSNANYGISMRNGSKAEVDGFNKLKADIKKAIKDAPDSAFGKPVTYIDKEGNKQTLNDFKLAGYNSIFNGSLSDIKSKADKFNEQTNAIHKTMWKRIAKRISDDKASAPGIATYLKLTSNDKSSWHRRGANIYGYSLNPKGANGTMYEMEHAMPATSAYLYLLDSALLNANKTNSNFDQTYGLVMDNYKLIALDAFENKKLGKAGLSQMMPIGWGVLDNSWWQRYFNSEVAKQDGGINPTSVVDINGNTLQDVFNINANGSPYIKGTFKSNANTEVAKNNIADKAMKNARSFKYSEKIKKARVFDFDDTLAQTKSNVLYTMPDGTTGKIDAATFAKDAGKMEAEGAKWDFSEFSKVMDGKKGPLFDVAKKIQDTRGAEDIFVLTARPQDAAGPIKEFLASLGLNIPLSNITGLSDGRPQAKADWMLGKFAEGYNDFYFTDDMLKNVKAVKDVLSVLDVKSKVQQARIKFSEKLSTDFNDMIERGKGVASKATFSDALARRRGQNQKRYAFFIPPSADDFRGLTMYTFAGKGKQGEMDQDFFDKALIKPYMRGVGAMELSKQQIKNDYRSLIKNYPEVRKRLKKKLGETKYNVDEAIRIFLWNQAGFTIPGLSKTDQKEVVKLVNEDATLTDFADGVKLVTRQDTYVEPNEFWDAGTILGDLNRVGREVNRKEYLAEFIENADIIFSTENLNKVQALYGFRVRESIENSLYRMKTGSNKVAGTGRIVEKWNEWVNNSVGAIMFFNRRSALLQMLSSVNFVNWSDNNPAKAALALANQPQYWKDVITLFNSDKLKQRRSGLEGDIQESEIAQASKKGGMNGVISYLLKIGFTPTQIADSIAISTGGATFYRNRINTYKKDGYEQAEAEKKAFSDFSEISDETQQSADPMLISGQQSSILGRLVLAFQNTPMQYTRLIKKAGQDLINGRGSKKTNISKILYYGFVQNLIFNTLQNALFALIPGFDDEDEEFATDKEKAKYDERKQRAEDSKTERIINGMIDSIVRGSGLAGAVAVTVKNTIREYIEYQEKPVFSREKGDIILAALQISPPIGSKARKINAALQTQQYEKDVIAERGFDVMIDGKFQLSPAYNMLGSSTAAFFNLPLDRAVDEVNSITEALDDRNTKWQRIALGLGWRSWDTGVKIEEHELIKTKAKKERKEQGKIKSKKTREINYNKNIEYLRYNARILNALPDSIRIKVVREQRKKYPGIPIPAYKLQLLEEKYLDLK